VPPVIGRWLERACEARDPGITSMKTDLSFEPLHDHPGYIALLARLHL